MDSSLQCARHLWSVVNLLSHSEHFSGRYVPLATMYSVIKHMMDQSYMVLFVNERANQNVNVDLSK